MKQYWVEKAGGPGNLQIREAPDPIPRTGEVRIRVKAAGVNFVDVLGRAGILRGDITLPFAPGLEVAGTIDAVGQGVTGLKEGDEVFALTGGGGYTDVISLPYRRVYRRLDWMSLEDAAALPISYLTAYLTLVVMGSLRPGDRVLIHNVGGAVGLAALDICRIIGAETYGTSSPEKQDLLRERGLKHPIDYRNWDYERVVNDMTNRQGMNLILDSLGGNHWQKNYRLLRPAGRLIHIGISSLALEHRYSTMEFLRARLLTPRYTPAGLMQDNKAIIGFDIRQLWDETELLDAAMAQIIAWYDEALFRPRIDTRFPFLRAADAHLRLQQRKNVGKVLLLL